MFIAFIRKCLMLVAKHFVINLLLYELSYSLEKFESFACDVIWGIKLIFCGIIFYSRSLALNTNCDIRKICIGNY